MYFVVSLPNGQGVIFPDFGELYTCLDAVLQIRDSRFGLRITY